MTEKRWKHVWTNGQRDQFIGGMFSRGIGYFSAESFKVNQKYEMNRLIVIFFEKKLTPVYCGLRFERPAGTPEALRTWEVARRAERSILQ